MQDFFKGKMGQFFTPRNLVRFAVEMIQPERSMDVLDPACGSGGFLLHALDYVRNSAEENSADGIEIYQHCQNFAKDRLFGIEINDQIARVCKMNRILHDEGHTNIISIDSLEAITRLQSFGKKLQKNNFDLILTNPPFGAKVKVYFLDLRSISLKRQVYLNLFKLMHRFFCGVSFDVSFASPSVFLSESTPKSLLNRGGLIFKS